MALHRQRGFTLIELMVTVAVIGILAAIAYPSYMDQIRKANRSAAQQFMLDVATREQQVMLDNRGYVPVNVTADFPNSPTAASQGINLPVPPKASDNYDFQVTLPSTSPPTFMITAVAKTAAQKSADGNADLTLSDAGVKTPSAKW